MNNKLFTNIKVGYTAGVYGNSGEQFLLIIFDDNGITAVAYDGMYGHESRVEEPLREAGYRPVHIPSPYGKMTRKDASYKYILSESDAIKFVKEYLNK